MPAPYCRRRARRRPARDSDRALSGRAVRPHAGRAGCWHGRAPGCTQSRSARHDGQDSADQRSPETARPGSPGRAAASRWRWSRPRQAMVAGGVLAAVLGLGVATGAGAPVPPPRRRATAAAAAHGRPPGGMARPTVSGKITAFSGDDITVETNGQDVGHRRLLVQHDLQDQPGAERGDHVQRVRAQGRRLHRRAGHQEQRRHRHRDVRHDRPSAADGQGRSPWWNGPERAATAGSGAPSA